MNFGIYLTKQLKMHPSVRPQDIVKLCFQAAFGAEHLLSDYESAKAYLEKELLQVAESDCSLYEQISDNVCRVNLSAWKAENLPAEWLMNLFAASCKTESNGKEKFNEYLIAADEILARSEVGFTMQEWESYLNEYKKSGMPAVHHSEQYRKSENPAYRIVSNRFCRAFPILKAANKYRGVNKPCVISIDGRAASGKTTLAAALKIALDADVIYMDDFFVPPELRSEKRFEKPGENIHHERFAKEVLPFVSAQEPFAYRIFDCGTADYNGLRKTENKKFRIVEGSYSTHPVFGSYSDITVFSDICAGEQAERIRNRNGEEMLKIFLDRWIPMEEEYFSYYSIKEKADILINSESEK